jgi:predicted acylesterase/phospholipase RssA
MKKVILVILSVCVLLIVISISSQNKVDDIQEPILTKPREGIALIMTGAAARISQEAALLEELDKRGLLKDLVFISGVSSGALNAVLLNGILNKKITWDEYKTILFNLKNEDIFIQEGKKFPVNTEPARQTFRKTTEDKLGYYCIGNLPITTSISFTHIENLALKKTVFRMCSRKINQESDTTLGLVDIMMATAAFPIVFPPARIANVKTIPDEKYVDGGVGDDHVPYHALLEFEKFRGVGVEKVYIISRNCDSIPQLSEELKNFGVDDNGLFDRLGFSLDALLTRGIIKRMEAYCSEAPELVPLTYVWIPDLKKNFRLFSFENMKEQYDLTYEWAKTHDPVLIKDFLFKYHEKKK